MAFIAPLPLPCAPPRAPAARYAPPPPPPARRARMSLAGAEAAGWLAANPAALQKVADVFSALDMPEWLVEYGHPGMMGFMILGMAVPGATIGWLGRLNADRKAGVKQKRLHENIMVSFALLALLGGLGGTLSVAMQGHDVWQTPHFGTSLLVLLFLLGNAVIAYSGFTIGNDGSPKGRLQGRKLHAYFGVAIMATILVHAGLGMNILMD